MSEAAPIAANRTLRRLPNATYRQREYLTETEVERLIEAARRRGRNGLPRRGADFAGDAMASARLSFVNCAGRRSIFGTAACTSIEPRAGLKACIPYTVRSSERCGHCKARARMSLSLKRARQRPRLGS